MKLFYVYKLAYNTKTGKYNEIDNAVGFETAQEAFDRGFAHGHLVSGSNELDLFKAHTPMDVVSDTVYFYGADLLGIEPSPEAHDRNVARIGEAIRQYIQNI